MDHNSVPTVVIPELQTDFLFRRRPLALAADLRPSWRIALLVLILHNCCRGMRSSRTRLHVIGWGTRSNETRRQLEAVVTGELNPANVIVRFDPFLDRALDFAIGYGLIARDGGKTVHLTASGRALANELVLEDSILKSEKKMLGDLGKSVSEALINRMFGWKD